MAKGRPHWQTRSRHRRRQNPRLGVIDDVHEISAEEDSSPEVYVPVTQGEPGSAGVVIRSALPTAVLAPTVMQVLRSLNPGQAAVELRPIESLVDRSSSPRRFFAILVAIFAALGLILASLGIYGVISYSVTRQTQEIGIRMALGATANVSSSPSSPKHCAWPSSASSSAPPLPSPLHTPSVPSSSAPPHRPNHLRRRGPASHRRSTGRRLPARPSRLSHQPHYRPPRQLEVSPLPRIHVAGSR